jgi:FMN-binding protein
MRMILSRIDGCLESPNLLSFTRSHPRNSLPQSTTAHPRWLSRPKLVPTNTSLVGCSEQFVGKTASAPLKLDADIRNISGATLSSRHVTEGVRRLLATYEVAPAMNGEERARYSVRLSKSRSVRTRSQWRNARSNTHSPPSRWFISG